MFFNCQGPQAVKTSVFFVKSLFFFVAFSYCAQVSVYHNPESQIIRVFQVVRASSDEFQFLR